MGQANADLRVCFVGDSFVAGVGDRPHRGWMGRLVEAAIARGHQLTGYNLGVRGDTSELIARRLREECSARLPADRYVPGLVLSWGVNDVVRIQGHPRVAPEERRINARRIFAEALGSGWPTLMVGPPPVSDDEVNADIERLDAVLAAEAAQHGITYVSVYASLVDHPLWRREVAADDGAHPQDAGYELLAGLIAPAWLRWVGNLAEPTDEHDPKTDDAHLERRDPAGGSERLSAADEQLVQRARQVIDASTDADQLGDGAHTMGCALRDENGVIHVGVNLYHFTGGPCAELVALGAARAAGAQSPQVIVAVGNNGRGVKNPCGRCRQVLTDNYPEIQIITATGQGLQRTSVLQLLPLAFDHATEQNIDAETWREA
ncbi:GDSL-type esterase/lipase family protein [Glutamicibacter sp.]|uniref:GDSL-type esterase/lipase family protein n=1 Tax=Glutamicibacter sp. TaxID=1931995 RepID=UPI0028BD8162|nr:GDSL-type esterase/lipase family protein [Glutamicibacter sp.]